jgi:hypothetical protein
MTELIVGGPLLLVAQNLVGFGDLTEFRRRRIIVGVAVGVVFLGEASIGLLDVFLVGPTLDAQHLVIIAFGHGSMRLLVYAVNALAAETATRESDPRATVAQGMAVAVIASSGRR